jgi:outer membrane protein assembly factor BamB
LRRDEIIISSFRAVTAYNPDDGEVLWKVGHRIVEVIPTPVVGCGRDAWAKRGPTASPSPVGVDGKVFFTNDMGETFVLKAGKAFELLHVNRMNEDT